ncbi:hypothetical protein BAMA_07005 [Bacillus manliponensis]|uniref:Uncharacterized protein n=1 Tax=Bacillus manliponensis TaxID=574376 RepID=A0A073JSP6_9BACI|nr:hypothetical protein [Bacillus manliponensis]KEK18104.1 hypothetical protein BAMA_07005 [Bacillus manliponensis]
MYSTFQYFLKAYCTLSVYEEEVLDVMQEFIEQENQETIEKLQHELLHMKQKEAWEEGCRFANDAGRMWSQEEAKYYIYKFLNILSK